VARFVGAGGCKRCAIIEEGNRVVIAAGHPRVCSDLVSLMKTDAEEYTSVDTWKPAIDRHFRHFKTGTTGVATETLVVD
jgi:hypothetical protein